MSLPEHRIDTKDLESVGRGVQELSQILDGNIGFGDPSVPSNPASTTRPTGAAGGHNGVLDNIYGSWVEQQHILANAAQTYTHNLGIAPQVSGSPNVRWLVFGFQHNGTGSDATSTLSLAFHDGDSVTADSIELRLTVGGGRTVNFSNPVTVTVFFIPAVRG